MRILAITAQPPWPARSGYQIRCWEILRRLAVRHEVALVTLAHRRDPGSEGWTDTFVRVHFVHARRTGALSLLAASFSRTPHHVLTHRLRGVGRAVAEEVARGVDVIHAHYLYFAECLPPRGAPARPACVLDQHNVDHEVWESYAAAEPGWIARKFFARQARLVRAYERAHLPDFDTVLSVSARDRERTQVLLAGAAPPSVSVARNGVDLDWFRPAAARPPTAVPTVVFTGTDARRNVQGLRWFLEKCWPAVRERVAGARCVVAGRFSPHRLSPEIRASPGLKLTGERDDLRPALADADVAIVPVRLGGGTKLKVLEAMASGLPTVVTPEAAAGLDARDGIEWLVRDDDAGYVEAVTRLLLDGGLRQQMGVAARRHVEMHHGWDAIVTEMEADLAGAARRVGES